MARDCVLPEDVEHYPFDLLEQWCEFLRRDIPQLFRSPEAVIAFVQMVLYDNFDFSDKARERFHRLLFERYGYECVSKTWWAKEKAQRLMPGLLLSTTGREHAEAV